MKKMHRLFHLIPVVLLFALLFPTPASANALQEDRVIFGESYTLESGKTLESNLAVFGGVIRIETDATVRGNVVAVGSIVTIDGTVAGDVLALGGAVTLQENAIIQGDFSAPGSSVSQEDGARVEGELDSPWGYRTRRILTTPRIQRTPGWRYLSVFSSVAKTAAGTLIIVALGALMLLIMPKAAETMTTALTAQPWHMLGFGALTALTMLVVGIFLTITICLIPVAILVGSVFALAVLAGWLALGYELGKRIAASLFKASWHPVLAAVVGNLILYLVAKGLGWIPCLGAFLVFVAALFGLGMVVTTLFGTHSYPKGTTPGADEQEVLFAQKDTPAITVAEQSETDQDEKQKKPTRKTKKTPPPDSENQGTQ